MKKIIVLAIAVLLSVASAVPAEACPLLPFGANARSRRQDRRANSGGPIRGAVRIVLPPYGR